MSTAAGLPLRILGRTLTPDLTLPETTIPAGGTLTLETQGLDGGSLWQGWAEISVTTGQVGGLAVFRQSAPGSPYSEGSVPIVAGRTSRFLLPIDNLQGFVTSMAIVNGNSLAGDSVSVSLRYESGQTIPMPPGDPTSLFLNALGHDAFALAARFGRVANLRGVAEFRSQTGQLLGLGLRFNPRLAFTALPVLRQ